MPITTTRPPQRHGVALYEADEGKVKKFTATVDSEGHVYRGKWYYRLGENCWKNRADAEAAAIAQIHAMIDAKESELIALRDMLVKANKRLAKSQTSASTDGALSKMGIARNEAESI